MPTWAASVDNMRASRAEQGCLEYALAADPVDEGRVILSERWASRPDLDAHIQGLAAKAQRSRSCGAERIRGRSNQPGSHHLRGGVRTGDGLKRRPPSTP